MPQKGKIRLLILLFVATSIVMTCSNQPVTSTKIDNNSLPAQKAITLALDLAKTLNTDLNKDEIEVFEIGNRYHVFIKKTENVKPPSLLFEIDLRTGECNHVPLK